MTSRTCEPALPDSHNAGLGPAALLTHWLAPLTNLRILRVRDGQPQIISKSDATGHLNERYRGAGTRLRVSIATRIGTGIRAGYALHTDTAPLAGWDIRPKPTARSRPLYLTCRALVREMCEGRRRDRHRLRRPPNTLLELLLHRRPHV